ncbi:MAG TPA: enoyl-CoA hydratase/isomerase family protein [Paralcaligenes sp.]
MYKTLTIQRSDRVVHINLDRSTAGNSLSQEMVGELQEIVDQSYEDGTALLVLGAQGRHFCTGFDLSQIDSETDDGLLARFVRIELLLQAIHTAPFTTLALGHGRIMGAGADLFAACELRWLVGSANFCFPGAAFGLVLGTGRLARLIGAERAREWVGSGRRIEPPEALACGLVTAEILPERLSEELERVAQRSQNLDPLTYKRIRAASGHDPVSQARDLYALAQSAARPGVKERIQRYRAGIKKP